MKKLLDDCFAVTLQSCSRFVFTKFDIEISTGYCVKDFIVKKRARALRAVENAWKP